MNQSSAVVVAEILRPRGNKGEVAARSQTDVPGRLEELRRANALLSNGESVSVSITDAWQHGPEWVFKFEGVDSIDAAERFRGADLWLPQSERGSLANGEHFRSDLLGCELIDSSSGKVVGSVIGWQHYGGPLLLEVTAGQGEKLIPFIPEMSVVDLGRKRIEIALAEGLLDL